MMTSVIPIQIMSFLISIFFMYFVLILIRKKKLREQYALLWLLVGLIMSIFSLVPQILQTLSAFFGVEYAPSLLFLAALIAVLSLLLHMTVIQSKLTEQSIRLAQSYSLLEQELRETKRQLQKKEEE